MAKYTSQFSGTEIDRRLMDVDDRWGAAYFDQTTYQWFGFRNEDEKQQYLETGDESLIVGSPVGFDFTGTINQVKVLNKMPDTNLSFTQQAAEMKITCSFLSQQKGITDTQWTEIPEDFEVTVAIDKGNVGTYETLLAKDVRNGADLVFDIKGKIINGANRVKVTAKGKDTGTTGLLTYTVTLTTMYLRESNFTWYKPFVENEVYSLGGVNIGGAIDKVLHVRVTGEGYSKEYEVKLGAAIYAQTAYAFKGMEFPTAGTGVYHVEIWLDASGLQSEHLRYNIICVSTADKGSAQLACIGKVAEKVYNGADNDLLEYCVYNCGQSTGSPTITLIAIMGGNETVISEDTPQEAPTGSAIKYSPSVEIESDENITLKAVVAYGNEGQALWEVDNSKAYPATKGAVFYLNPATRSNSQGNREKVVNAADSSEVDTVWKAMSWEGDADGWVADETGRKCLKIPAGSKAEISYQPLKNGGPCTIELLYRVANASNYNEPVITVCSDRESEQFEGIRLTPKNICAMAIGKKDYMRQGYNLTDEEVHDIIVTIVPEYKTNYGNLAQIYCNGEKVRSFDFGKPQDWKSDNNIVLGSATADLYLYKMRVYSKGFGKTDATQNYINSLPPEDRDAMSNALKSVTDDSYELDYETCVKNGKNTMVIEMLDGKDIPSLFNTADGLKCNLEINIRNIIKGELDEEMQELLAGKEITGQSIEGQGTTAMTYGRWNFRWKLDKNYNKRRITAKKNVASSMQGHKMGATRMFNYLYEKCVGKNEAGAKVAVLQYPAYGFQKTFDEAKGEYVYLPIGLYTVGADKGDKKTFGYDQEEYEGSLIHMEGSDHTPKAVGFDYPWDKTRYVSETSLYSAGITAKGDIEVAWEVGMAGGYETDSEDDVENIQNMLNEQFRPAYEVAYNNSPYLTGVDTLPTSEKSGYEIWLSSDYNVYYFDREEKKYKPNGVNLMTDLGISETELAGMTLEEKTELFIRRRKGRFSNEWGNYWHKDDAIFHYVFCMLIGATDNYKKNTYPYKFKPLEDGGRWRWRADDLDTIFDINNQGLASKTYSILVGDKTESGNVYRGEDSVFWTLIRETQQKGITDMVHAILEEIRKIGNAENIQESLVKGIKHFFWDMAQDYFPASAYNTDAEWTYEDMWANKKTSWEVPPLSQALGGHYEAERDWIVRRMIFISSYYNYGIFSANGYLEKALGQLSYGAGASGHTFTITPAIDMNPTVIQGQTLVISTGKRVKEGESQVLTVPGGTNDTRRYLQGLDWIRDLGDMSTLELTADNPTLEINAKRLENLKVGDSDEDKVKNNNLTTLKIGNCPSLQTLDARNLSSLVGILNLSGAPRLRKVLLGGSAIEKLTLPTGAKITHLQLPESITELSLVGLKELGLYMDETGNPEAPGLLPYGVANITQFRLENCPQLHGFVLLQALYFEAKNLSHIRLIGFDYEYGNRDDLNMLANIANDLDKDGNKHDYYGLDANGNETPIPVIEGTLTIQDDVYLDAIEAVQKTFPGIKVKTTGNVYLRFKDAEANKAYEAAYPNRQMTKAWADSLTNLPDIFKGKTLIRDLSDLGRLFPNATTVNPYAFKGCTLLEKIDLGGCREMQFSTTYDTGLFMGCTSLHTVVANKLTNLSKGSFQGCTSLKEIDLPEMTTLDSGTFNGCTSLTKVSLPKVTTFGAGTFRNCASLTEVSLPKATGIDVTTGVPKPAQLTFTGCTSLKEIYLPEMTALGGYTFNGCTSLTKVSLPKVTEVGAFEFENCTALKEAYLPEVKKIGDKAFMGCNIEEIDLPKVTSLGKYCFAHYDGTENHNSSNEYLRRINAPNTTYVDEYAFVLCLKLSDITMPSLKTIGIRSFGGCAVKELSLVEATDVGEGAFTQTGLERITLGKVSDIPKECFYDCNSLSQVDAPNLTKVGEDAFSDCELLEQIDIENVTDAGRDAFYYCRKLSEVPDNATTIGARAFAGTAVEAVELNELEVLGEQTFLSCTSLQTFVGRKVKEVNTGTIYASGPFYLSAVKFLAFPVLERVLGQGSLVGGSTTHVAIGNDTPPTLDGGFESAFSSIADGSVNCNIYVPDGAINDYYETWSPPNGIEIKGLSELPEEYKNLLNEEL